MVLRDLRYPENFSDLQLLYICKESCSTISSEVHLIFQYFGVHTVLQLCNSEEETFAVILNMINVNIIKSTYIECLILHFLTQSCI